MKKASIYYLIIVLIFVFVFGCIEPYQLETNTFENALVVECTIENEMKTQKITVSRVFRLESNEPAAEQNAQVWIEDSNQNNYSFSESKPGVYYSDNEFNALPDVGYTLFVKTSSGGLYESRERKVSFFCFKRYNSIIHAWTMVIQALNNANFFNFL